MIKESDIPIVIICSCIGVLVGKLTGSWMVLNGVTAGLGSVAGILLNRWLNRKGK